MRRWLLILALAIGAQPPRAYFSLNTQRTFAPGEKVGITYTAQNVASLEFRVYKVNDPVRFFQQLPDPHSFGGQAPPVPKARTLLERFHSWKSATRHAMRSTLRRQFGDEEHFALVRTFRREARRIPKGPGGDRYVGVPLLNPQQLVRSWRVNVDRKNPWEGRAVDFDVPGSGLYVVEATDGELRAATIVNVTPLAIVKKTAPGRVLAMVVDRATGAPVPDVPVKLVLRRGDTGEVRTDGRGIAEIRATAEGERAMTLLAMRSSDVAIANVEYWSLRNSSERLAMGYVYTDRPIYRPGHKVGYRAILRGETDSGWVLPDTKEVTCEIRNPEGTVVEKRTLALTKYGTVSGEFTVPANAPLGYFSVALSDGESSQSGSFQVDEYRKPEYEVKVRASQPRILQGGKAEFVVEAKYFFGEPVVGAKLKYSVRTLRYWFPFWAEEADDEEGGTDFYGEQAGEDEAKLDAQGRATVSVPTKLVERDVRYVIEAKVTDQAAREVVGRGGLLATVGNFALQARSEKYVYALGESARIFIEIRNYDGTPVANQAFTIEVGKAVARGVTGADGKGSATTTMPGAGSWKGTAYAMSAGRKVTDDLYLWVSGSFRDDSRGEQITLVPDKKSYKPGDVAKVLVVTGVPEANVLLGVEGRGLLHSESRVAKEESFVYEVPIRPEHVPNIFVTAAFIKDGKYYQGSKSLKVPPTEKVFAVEIKPSKERFKPGEPASYELLAKDALGKPVSAEFTLGIVDEALYGVAPDTTPAIDKAFYGRIYDRVQTDSSLNYYFYGSAGKRAMPLAQLRRSTLAQVKPPNLTDPRVRKAFPDTALWLATLTTDEQGKATTRLQFPDSITAWRATARGVTADTRVGGAVNRVITRKDLILRLAAPRFLTDGDEVTVSAIVNNYLPGDVPLTVSLEAKGLSALDGKSRQGTATAGRETKFDFRLKTTGADRAALTAKAIATEDSDALEIDLPVKPYGVPITEAYSGTLTDSGKVSQDLKFPADSRSPAIEVRTMPSLAGAIFGALEYLNTYPYGCTEQTLSSFVPNATVQNALESLKLPSTDRRRLNKQIADGLERLVQLQHPDGGWGFWESDDSNAFMTANVIAALNDFGQWGHINPEQPQTWLRRTVNATKRIDPDFRAFAAYALRDQAMLDAVWADRDALSPYGLALLGLRVDPSRQGEIAARLTKLAQRSDVEAYWKLGRDPLMDLEWDTSPEATATAIKFLTKVNPSDPLLSKAVRWLVNHRNDGYYWSSTRQTATVIYGLTDYLKHSGELNPELQAIVRINGESVYNKELKQADALAPHPAGIRAIPKGDTAKVEIESNGKGRLYWSVTATRYEDRLRVAAPAADLAIRRQYFRRLPGGTLTAFDGRARVGEEIVSRTTVTGGTWKYLLVEDPIPAGGEWSKKIRAGYWWTHRELRDDRAAMFETYFDKSRQYESVIKINRPGKYRVSPARVTPMYQPGVIAYSDPAVIEVEP